MRKLGELARLIGAELAGDEEAIVTRARPFDTATEGDVTFASEAAYIARLSESRATAVIVSASVNGANRNLLIARNPKLAFARAIELLHSGSYTALGISGDLICGQATTLGSELSIYPRVTIGSEAVIGDRVTLHPGVVIGDRCRIGDDSVIYANVTVYADCEIGKRTIVHSGTVIGADGFGFVPDEEGHQVKLLHLGRVIIEDECEIGANCAIDRGGFGDTILRRGVKLDNLIQVGHNCEIGEDTVVVAMTGFSGGVRVGRGCVIGGQVGVNQHVIIGDGAIIMGRGAVTKNVPPGARVAGIPARDYNAWRRSQVLYSQLPDLADRLKEVERNIEERTNEEPIRTERGGE
jgi:UDP-3-O-[3-hydroxymyristoyl] glucosamine N-acyltransferase